jgi:capsule polysaccharide modification protein KpsS
MVHHAYDECLICIPRLIWYLCGSTAAQELFLKRKEMKYFLKRVQLCSRTQVRLHHGYLNRTFLKIMQSSIENFTNIGFAIT